MEETIPYYGDLHIDEGTKKLILNLLRSIRSVVPVVTPPGPKSLEEESDLNGLDYILNTLVLARQHSEELSGLVNPDELLKYSRYISDYQEILNQLEQTIKEIKTCRDSAMKFASGMAEMVEGHIRMTLPLDKYPETETERETEKETETEYTKGKERIQVNRNGVKLKVV